MQRILALFCCLLFLGLLLACGGGGPGNQSSSTPGEKKESFDVRIGEERRINTDAKAIPVCIDTETLDEALASILGGHEDLLVNYARRGKLAVVENGTLVRIVGTDWGRLQVLVLEGPSAGYKGVIEFDWVRPAAKVKEQQPAPPAPEPEKPKAPRYADPDSEPKTSLPRSEDTLPIKLVTPPKDGRLVLATTPKVLEEYNLARARGRDAEAKEFVTYKKVMVVTRPVKVRVEGAYKGHTYVRVLVGPNAGKLYMVETKYVK